MLFEELDFESTPFGEISLRRRKILSIDQTVYEVKLNDEWLMSSLFTVVEERLSELGLAAIRPDRGDALEVVVGGLGLGHTALAALADSRVAEVVVVEAVAPVIRWHREGLVPLGEQLTADNRCRFIQSDFFQLATTPEVGFDPERPARKWDAVLLDIDHSPEKLLNPENGAFYTETGLLALAEQIRPGGVFAMWSDDPPHDGFMKLIGSAFEKPEAHIVPFENPLQGNTSESTVYVAVRSA